MKLKTAKLLALLVLACHLVLARGGEDWPQFRGPYGNGHSDARALPLQWSETQNVAWKTPIHDRGWSSPVIYGNQVWLTTATRNGKELYAVCVDKDSGTIIKDLKLFDVSQPQFCDAFNSYASPSPVIEDGRVYVTFGAPGTACIDTKTFRVLWGRRDIECNHFRGAGSSPILFQNLVIMNFDGSDRQFITALDKRSGKTVWQTRRSIDFQDLDEYGKPAAEGDLRKAFSTPHVATIHGKLQLISLGAKAAYAYNPRTGEEIWRVEERAQHSASTRPVITDKMIFWASGFPTSQLLAARFEENGLVKESSVVWRMKRAVPNKPSILLVGDLIYMINDTGIATCLESATGEIVWQHRIGGEYSASPIHADGKIWIFSEEGKTRALEPGRTFKLLAENQLEDGFMASPAAAGDSFYLRTKSHLYRIRKQ
jgi:outer membrane protein assembly factor BamB